MSPLRLLLLIFVVSISFTFIGIFNSEKTTQRELVDLNHTGTTTNTHSPSEAEIIRFWGNKWDILKHRTPIELILDQTVDSHGPYKLVKSRSMPQNRAIESLRHNKYLDLIIIPADKERERILQPIGIQLPDSIILSYRICLIRQGTQNKFIHITSLNDWHNSGLVMGSVVGWVDTDILKQNSILLEISVNKTSIVNMLIAGRINCFPRGITEIGKELAFYNTDQNTIQNQRLSIEQNLLFFYPMIELPFINKKNERLKSRLEAGYQKLRQSVVWQQLNEANRLRNQEEFKNLNLYQRNIIRLENPNLSDNMLDIPLEQDPLGIESLSTRQK